MVAKWSNSNENFVVTNSIISMFALSPPHWCCSVCLSVALLTVLLIWVWTVKWVRGVLIWGWSLYWGCPWLLSCCEKGISSFSSYLSAIYNFVTLLIGRYLAIDTWTTLCFNADQLLLKGVSSKCQTWENNVRSCPESYAVDTYQPSRPFVLHLSRFLSRCQKRRRKCQEVQTVRKIFS